MSSSSSPISSLSSPSVNDLPSTEISNFGRFKKYLTTSIQKGQRIDIWSSNTSPTIFEVNQVVYIESFDRTIVLLTPILTPQIQPTVLIIDSQGTPKIEGGTQDYKFSDFYFPFEMENIPKNVFQQVMTFLSPAEREQVGMSNKKLLNVSRSEFVKKFGPKEKSIFEYEYDYDDDINDDDSCDSFIVRVAIKYDLFDIRMTRRYGFSDIKQKFLAEYGRTINIKIQNILEIDNPNSEGAIYVGADFKPEIFVPSLLKYIDEFNNDLNNNRILFIDEDGDLSRKGR